MSLWSDDSRYEWAERRRSPKSSPGGSGVLEIRDPRGPGFARPGTLGAPRSRRPEIPIGPDPGRGLRDKEGGRRLSRPGDAAAARDHPRRDLPRTLLGGLFVRSTPLRWEPQRGHLCWPHPASDGARAASPGDGSRVRVSERRAGRDIGKARWRSVGSPYPRPCRPSPLRVSRPMPVRDRRGAAAPRAAGRARCRRRSGRR